MNDTRIAIVGGGPVGLAAALFAARAGMTPIVIEARDTDGDKACGEGLMPGVMPLLEELGIDPPGHDLLGVSYRQGARQVDHFFPVVPGRGVRRTVLVDAMRNEADRHGIERVHARVTGLTQNPSQVRLHCAAHDDIEADYVLACDGLHSTIARQLGLVARPRRRARRYGLRQHFHRRPWSSMIEVYYAGDTELYITPVDDETVGVAVLGPKGVNLAQTIAQVPEVSTHLEGVSVASGLRGAGPFPYRAHRAQVGRVLLVGDAAGYVDAITGEGLRVGFAQAREAVSAVGSGQPASYPRRWRSVTREFRLLTKGLVVLASSPLRSSIVPLASTAPRVFGVVVDRLAR
jgi:flavin-dependent dehydrogenase